MMFTLLLAATISAGCPPPGFRLTTSDESPRHTFRIESYISEDAQTLVCLRDSEGDAAQLGSRSILQVSNRIYVSPDDHWIARVQHGHGGTAVHLYERHGAVDFAEVGPSDFSFAAWEFYRLQSHASLRRGYIGSVATGTWLPNSHTLLVELAGDDGQTRIRSWYCYYDLEKQRFYLDATLERKNKDAVPRIGPPRPNQAMQPTAGRREDKFLMTQAPPLQPTRALASGG